MISIKGKITGLQETVSAIGQIPSLLQQAGIGAMTECLELFSTTLRQDFLEGPYPDEIQSRTHSFSKTFRRGQPQNIFEVSARGSTIIGRFGSEDIRARILNEGGIIRPKTARLLAVRTEFTKTSGGVVRAKYQQPLRNLPHTFLRMGKPKAGRQVRGTVFEKIGNRIIPIAWLVLYVLIKGRKFMQKTLAKASPQFEPIFQKRFDMILTKMHNTLSKLRGG